MHQLDVPFMAKFMSMLVSVYLIDTLVSDRSGNHRHKQPPHKSPAAQARHEGGGAALSGSLICDRSAAGVKASRAWWVNQSGATAADMRRLVLTGGCVPGVKVAHFLLGRIFFYYSSKTVKFAVEVLLKIKQIRSFIYSCTPGIAFK